MIKRGLWAVGALVAAALLVVIALPFAASTRLVRDRIALELSTWTGYEVRIAAPPQIEVWPSFRAILTDVSLSPWNAGEHPPVLKAERVEFNLSAVAALTGGVEFSSARLIRPTLVVDRTPEGFYLPALPGGGRMADSIKAAKAVVAAKPEAPDTALLPSNVFGAIEVTEGRIVALSGDQQREMITELSGQVNWAALNKAATVSMRGKWRGEAAALDLSSPAPMLLFAGGSAGLKLSLKSARVTASFDGTAKLGENPYFQGQTNVTSPSFKRALEWWQAEVAPSSVTGPVTVASRITGDAARVKFENTEITLDGAPGMGALELSLTEAVPALSGTLAFDALNLQSFLSAFTPLTPAGSGPGEIDASFANNLDLDLRLSAAQATAGTTQLTDVAATVQVKGGLAAFDISDATAFGGTVQAGLRFDRKPEGTQVEVRLLASDIEGGAFGSAAGLTRLVPIGKGTVSVILKGAGKDWNQMLGRADGSVSANFGAGALTGLDINAFLKRAQQGGFFPLAEIASNSLPIKGMEVKATVTNGVMKLDRAEVTTEQRKIAMSGIVPLASQGLALTGTVAQIAQPGTDAASPARSEAAFFVGGSWATPFISPIYPILQGE